MQFLSGLSGPGRGGGAGRRHDRDDRARVFAREALAGSHLPYAAQVDPRTVLLRDGALMQAIRLDGLMFETADTEELNQRKALREAMLRAVGSPRFAMYHHILRRRVRPAADGVFPDAFSHRLDAAWQRRLAARQLYASELFVTLVHRPPEGRGGWVGRAQAMLGLAGGAAGRRGGDAALQAEVRALDAAREQLAAALAAYGPRVLEAYEAPGGMCSEVLEMLGAFYNGGLRPVLLPRGDVGDYLPGRRVSFGRDTLEMGPGEMGPGEMGPGENGPGGGGDGFAAILSVKDYPGETIPGMLDDLLRLPCEMLVSQSFAFVERRESLARMNLALRRMRASDDEAVSLRADLAEAKDQVAAGRALFGEHHLSVMLRGASQRAVDAAVAEAQAEMADLGIVAVREEIGLEAAFWAQFPGNFSFIARGALIGTGNFASLASLHNFPSGQAHGNEWGDAIATFETTAASPYHFNFHRGDLGNFTVIGPSGSGKTVIVNFLLAQARRLSPRIVLFDKDRGAELFIRAIGGRYDVLRPGVPSGLNPLLLPDSAASRRFLIDWVGRLAGAGPEGLAPEEARVVKEAVDASYRAPPAFRRLSSFVDLLRGGARPREDDLYARLRPWWGGGEHAWLFDNPGLGDGTADAADLAAEAVGFDMTRLLDDPVLRTPAMLYLFHRVDERLDGSPAIIVVDEGWKALDDPVFARQIRDWEKTIRKRGGIVGLVTQNAGDALDSSIAGAIVEQAATQIFTANAKAREADYCGGFGLSSHEFALIRSLPEEARCFLVRPGGESVVLRLDLSGEEELLVVLSGRERTVRACDAIRARVGDDPAAWLPELLVTL